MSLNVGFHGLSQLHQANTMTCLEADYDCFIPQLTCKWLFLMLRKVRVISLDKQVEK